jgi:hypothetical protein
MENLGRPAPHALGQPFTPDNHENAKMIALDQRFLAGNWEKLEPADSSLARGFANRLPALWQADRAGASLRFSFRGRWACVYDLLGPDGGELEVIVDGRAPTKAQRFDAYCTYHRLGMLALFSDTNSADHSVTVRLTSTSFDKVAILRRNGNTMDKPERYAPLRWQAGAILIDGELIEPLPTSETAATAAHRRASTKSEPDAVIYEATYPGWPWVARGRDGTLHCVFREGTEHDFSAAGKALLCQSRDGGRTWSKPTVIVDHAGVDDRNVAITVLTNGQLLVVFNTYDAARASLAMRTHSADGGRTWSPPTAID